MLEAQLNSRRQGQRGGRGPQRRNAGSPCVPGTPESPAPAPIVDLRVNRRPDRPRLICSSAGCGNPRAGAGGRARRHATPCWLSTLTYIYIGVHRWPERTRLHHVGLGDRPHFRHDAEGDLACAAPPSPSIALAKPLQTRRQPGHFAHDHQGGERMALCRRRGQCARIASRCSGWLPFSISANGVPAAWPWPAGGGSAGSADPMPI